MDGGVELPEILSDTNEEFAQIVEVEVKAVDGMEKFGQIASAKLTLEGCLMPATWNTKSSPLTDIEFPVGIEGHDVTVYSTEGPYTQLAKCVFDCGSAVLADQANVKALAAMEPERILRYVWGILLEPHGASTKEFVRLGVWFARSGGVKDHIEKGQKKIIMLL